MADETIVIDVGEDPQEEVQPKSGVGFQKRTEEQRVDDLELMAKLQAERKSQRDIRDHLNSIRPYTLSLSQVQKDLRKLDKYYILINGALTREQKKYRELLSIERQEREAWEAWERSKQDSMVQRQESYDADTTGKTKTKKVVEKEKNVGDPRYLQVMIALREQRIRLEGLDEPTKTVTEINATVNNGANLEAFRQAYKKKILSEVAPGLLKPAEPEPPQERFPVKIESVTLNK